MNRKKIIISCEEKKESANWTDDGRLIAMGGEELFVVNFYPSVGEASVMRPRLSRT